MFEEELPESDSSDEDFAPEGERSDVSEEESDDAEVEAEEDGIKKRKQVKSCKGNRKKKKVEKQLEQDLEEEKEQVKEEVNPEERKKKDDALWADFLKDCGPVVKKKPEPVEASSSAGVVVEGESSSDRLRPETSKQSQQVNVAQDDQPDSSQEKTHKVLEVYEFAGEKVVVEKKLDMKKRPVSRGGGAAAILSQLNRKSKLSTLEKSKLDWESFKSKEGINEQLSAHNKGKNGYLERQDFLERADLRQFEIEKQMRAYNRSKRV